MPWWLVLLGCPAPDAPRIALDGPARVRVESLGPVDGPHAVLADGTHPDVDWTVTPADVAKLDPDGHIDAVGTGEATVSGTWEGQKVSWQLVVEPVVALSLVDPPRKVNVGDHVPLRVEGRVGEQVVTPGALRWSSSAPSVVAVSQQGEITAAAPGVAYVTVTSGKSEAMLEVDVTR